MKKTIEVLVWYAFGYISLGIALWYVYHATAWWALYWTGIACVDACFLYDGWYKIGYVLSALLFRHRVEKSVGVPVSLEITFDDEATESEDTSEAS